MTTTLTKPPRIDYTGTRINLWTILAFVGRDKQRHARYRVRCDCGEVRVKIRQDMERSQGCGQCLLPPDTLPAGQKIHDWTILEYVGHNKCGKTTYRVMCGCSNQYIRTIENIKQSPRCRSCTKTIHGMNGTPEHNAWMGAIGRCTNPKDRSYKNYGGRGIKVCDRWLESFENFYADMGDRPEGKTLDRTDNNKGYEPSNCRWATRSEQNRNKRTAAKAQARINELEAELAEWKRYGQEALAYIEKLEARLGI